MLEKIISENMSKLKELEKETGYTFKDPGNLVLALTHSSYANEKKAAGLKSNERLEFLGDSVLNIVTSDYIYRNYPELHEGEMTRTRAAVVCEASLMRCAERIRLGEYLFLGKGEENTGGRTRSSILSDAFEALIGAIYIDGGISAARRFILRYMEDIYQDIDRQNEFRDYKTMFQEIIQKQSDQKIHYRILDESGPDHDKTFTAQVLVGNEPYGEGKGRSKKEAEQNAAKDAINNMQVKK
ncbi:MAG: ribonuclease III [Clostridiaceae bacterium]|jgi:ribonuclease-3|nr:ribonuclease III [Clostridiaceae bacterium]